MLRSLFLLIMTTLAIGRAAAQQVTKVIDMGVYKSYFSATIKEPLYVTYPLYKGGGPCDRQAEHFSFGKCGEETASNSDYSNSHYEKGHLANAEDFAGNCSTEKKTFCYYNCIPQTKVLNHGKWLTWEGKIRQLSQTRHLFIVTGSIFGTQYLKPGSTVLVPTACYKVVLDAVTKVVLYCMLFTNDNSDNMQNLSLSELKERLSYPLVSFSTSTSEGCLAK